MENIDNTNSITIPLSNINPNVQECITPSIFSCIIQLFTKGLINTNCEYDPILKCIEEEASLKNPNPYIPLIISSSLFFSSGIVAFINELWSYFILSLITTGISINHWRDVRNGPRRTMDLIGAKISFVLFFISGCFAIHITILQWIAVPICIIMFILYYCSNYLREHRIKYWIYVHFVFHLLVAFEQLLVVLYIAENMKMHNSYWRKHEENPSQLRLLHAFVNPI